MHTQGPLFVNLMYFCLNEVLIRMKKRVGVETGARVVAHMLAPGCFS